MGKFKELAQALKLEHTIFALPFAFLGVWVASAGSPSLGVVVWVMLAMVAGRTAGMALNRWVDLPIDRINPRTKAWPVSVGKISPDFLLGVAVFSLGLFFWAAAQLNPLCLKGSPFVFLLILVYPYTKRFTWTCHFWLGLVLGVAPAAGWLAVTGYWDSRILPLMMGVLFWVAGFDILYALLDLDFDRAHSVYSIPQRFGLVRSLWISAFCHLVSVLSFAWFGFRAGMGVWFWVGFWVVAALLIYEHKLVYPARIDRITKAFFTVNGWISISFFLFTLLDLKWKCLA